MVNNELLEKMRLFVNIQLLMQRRRGNLYYINLIHVQAWIDVRESERQEERRGRKQKYLVHDKCPDTHHGTTTSRRVPQNRATMRPLVTIMLKCNLLITAAAPSRSLISPICTAVGERKQNGNERPVPPGRMIRDKEGGIGDAEGMVKRDRGREEERVRERERTDNGGRDWRYEKK